MTLRATTWTLSQQGLLALDVPTNYLGSIVSATPQGDGVVYQISFTSTQGQVGLQSILSSGTGALLGLPLTPNDSFALKFTLLTSTPNSSAYVSTGAIINFSGTYGYAPVGLGGPYSYTVTSNTFTNETQTKTVGWIAYIAPADSSSWPASGASIQLFVEPANGATVLAPANTVGSGLRFIPIPPCRAVDTRLSVGPLGGPAISSGQTRSFTLPSSACGIPAYAAAYSLNATVIPHGPLGYLTLWPAGQSQPLASTLNSGDGRVKANAAIVPAGVNGAVNAYATDPTDLVFDINGYFVAPSVPALAALVYYPLTPCRLVDSRAGASQYGVGLGGPFFTGGQVRSLPLLNSSCGLPPTAKAYALNITTVPHGPLGYLTAWPTGQTQPPVSTLNAPTGTVVANMAIVPSGSAYGAISTFVTDSADVIIDVNGYFAPPGAAGGLSFFALEPCRVVDTRNPTGPLGGPIMTGGTTRNYPIPSANCGMPLNAGAYSLNATVVPQAPLGYLTLWPAGLVEPPVSTLNSSDGTVVANAALIPAGSSGALNAFVTGTTTLILDANGYFQSPVSYSILATPFPTAPANGTVFSVYPRTTTLTWTSVLGATAYGVEVQYCQTGFSQCVDQLIEATTNTTYTFGFIGAQPGRWRVWATDSTTGRASAVSDWLTFSYTI